MNCQDARAAILEGETSGAISSHLAGCVACRRSLGAIESIRSDLTSESVWAEPPAGLGDDIFAAITGTERPPAVDAAPVSISSWKSWTTRSVVIMFGSVAAALVLLVGAFSMLTRAPGPDWEVAMVGTLVAPSATAVVAGWNTDAGTRVVLEASNLGPAPEGFVYQLWLSRGSDHVSAGTFTDPSRVVLTVGVARKNYPDVWISLQPITTGAGNAGPALLRMIDT